MGLTISALLLSFTIYTKSQSHSTAAPATKVTATCYGKTPCNACKNCKYCKHCSVNKGTCGVCK